MRPARARTAVKVEEWVQPHTLLRASRTAPGEMKRPAPPPRTSPIKEAIIRWLEQEL